jgi:succinate-semialdehyde dehydrogenase/glutarate-semialdehyde dehydrogenase
MKGKDKETPARHARDELETPALTVVNPASEEVVQAYQQHTEAEVEVRLARAAEAFKDWRRTTFAQRAKVMSKVAELLKQNRDRYAHLMTTEMGKPIVQSEGEIDKCAAACEFYAKHAEAFLSPLRKPMDGRDRPSAWVRFEPLGPILAIMPWNFPFWQVFRFAVPSLMAGNVGILKHAANVSGTALAIEDLFRAAGFPSGVLTSLLVSSSRIAGIIAHQSVRAVTLTGSEQAGIAVAVEAGKQIKKTVLELGGSDPFVVLADANVEQVARQAAKARTINSGQSCIAAKRFIVEEPLADRFQAALVRNMESLVVGHPLDRSTDVGPLARKDLVEQLHDQVIRSTRAGAKLRTGGQALTVDGKGFYYAPTVLGDVGAGAIDIAAFAEETFGPVALVVRAKNTGEAIALANHSSFGLGASLWTGNTDRAAELAEQIDAGCVFVNEIVKSDPRLPFGGVKRSGYGRELSDFGIREFVNVKTVWVGG